MELDAADRWIFERLSASAALVALVGVDETGAARIYPDAAPEGTPYPFVVYALQSPRPDRRAIGAGRIMVQPLYLVKAYAEQSHYRGVLADLDALVDAALDLGDSAAGPVADEGYLIGCRRTEAFRQVEREAGTEFRARGGFYELWISA